METAKQKAIREAYGEHWEFLKEFINEEGWFQDYVLGESEYLSIWALSNCDKEFDSIGIVWRYSTLKGIETNNGWITIKSEADLPKETDQYFVLKNGVVDIGIYSKTYNKWMCSGQYYFATLGDLKITHYQPIEKPKPPIY